MTTLLSNAQLAVISAMTWVRARYDAGNDTGATAVEYGIMVALIAAVIIVMVALLGKQVLGAFTTTCNALKTGVSGTASTC
jgi:pilus assembly protein Flp/PilA